ncbi:hypothetical protein D3C87_2084370 [compost metagenome]
MKIPKCDRNGRDSASVIGMARARKWFMELAPATIRRPPNAPMAPVNTRTSVKRRTMSMGGTQKATATRHRLPAMASKVSVITLDST